MSSPGHAPLTVNALLRRTFSDLGFLRHESESDALVVFLRLVQTLESDSRLEVARLVAAQAEEDEEEGNLSETAQALLVLLVHEVCESTRQRELDSRAMLRCGGDLDFLHVQRLRRRRRFV